MIINGQKGITPIIAIILLLMMTVAVAGAAFFWLSRIQNQLQGGVESFQGTMMTQIASKVDVVAANYINNTNLTIFFQNTGNTKIPVTNLNTFPTTTWILKDENQVAICSSNWLNASSLCTEGCGTDVQMSVGEMHKVVLTLGSPCSVPLSVSGGKVYSFTVDFSGKTTASGSFVY